MTESQNKHNWRRTVGIVLLGFVALIVIYAAVIYLGWQSGQAARATEAEQALVAQIERQIDLAQIDFQNNNLPLAATRIEWVLERAPQNTDALALKSGIDTALTVVDQATPEPTPTPLPTPESAEISDGDQTVELAYLQRLLETEAWEELIAATNDFRVQYPDYDRQATDPLLFEAYLNLGLELAWTDRIELGLTYLERAEQLGALPQQALDQQVLSALYLDGLSYYGVRWEVAIPNFQQICNVTPFYLDSCERLLDAKILYGDQWAFADQYCPAASWYAEAALVDNSQELIAKLNEARSNCANATPTPEPTPELPDGEAYPASDATEVPPPQ